MKRTTCNASSKKYLPLSSLPRRQRKKVTLAVAHRVGRSPSELREWAAKNHGKVAHQHLRVQVSHRHLEVYYFSKANEWVDGWGNRGHLGWLCLSVPC